MYRCMLLLLLLLLALMTTVMVMLKHVYCKDETDVDISFHPQRHRRSARSDLERLTSGFNHSAAGLSASMQQLRWLGYVNCFLRWLIPTHPVYAAPAVVLHSPRLQPVSRVAEVLTHLPRWKINTAALTGPAVQASRCCFRPVYRLQRYCRS